MKGGNYEVKRVGRVIKLHSGELVRVSEEDYEYLSQFKWCLFKSEKWKYAVRNVWNKGKQITVYMHRDIMKVKGRSVYVDHRDQDGLNNRRENLRVCDNRLNQYNVGKKSSSKQKYKNIRLYKNRWQVRFRLPKGVRIEKSFKEEKDAVDFYNTLALKYHGEFAVVQRYEP